MTPTLEEKQQAAQIDMAQATERVNRALHGEMLNGQNAAPSTYVPIATLGEVARAEEKPARAPRKTPIAGKCVNCGRNWSRHFVHDKSGMEIPYCTKDHTTTFSLERKQAEAPAQASGALTQDQYKALLRLDGIRSELRIAAQEIDDSAKLAWQTFNKAEADYFNYLTSLTAH